MPFSIWVLGRSGNCLKDCESDGADDAKRFEVRFEQEELINSLVAIVNQSR
jgi:hypothetical protein